MSVTQQLTTDATTRKIWAKKDYLNIGQKTVFGHLMDRGAIFFAEDFLGERARGDEITYDYVNKLTGLPVGEGGTLVGNEEALDKGSFKLAMNETRVAVKSPNKNTIEQQRTNLSFENMARKVIPARHAELIDTSVFYQLAGADPTSFTLNGTTWSGAYKKFVQGHNSIVAPTTNRIVRPASAATDQALTSADTMTLDLVDYMIEKNGTSDQPIMEFDDGTMDLFISHEQYVDLKHDAAGKIQWFNIELAKLSGGMDSNIESFRKGNMIVAGKYGNVNIYVAPRVAYGVNSGSSAVITSVRRAVLVGKDALTFASPYGGRMQDDGVPLMYETELQDFGYYKAIEGRFIGGLKKNTATNSEDIGVMVLSTYAASHS